MAYTDGSDITGASAPGDPDRPSSNRMSDSELRAILDAEKSDALAATKAATLSGERERAMRYYLGDMQRDLPAQDGKSRAVSNDVSDTIEGLMPSLMEIFCGSDDVVRFEPVGPEDVQAAQQETDYVNYVFMQKNPGFLVLYSFIKDSLLSKNGFVKVWTEKEEREEKTTYYDQPEDVFALLTMDPRYEVVAHTMKLGQYGQLHDVTVVYKNSYNCHRVQAVPPEEVGFERNARNLADAGYVYHETAVSRARAIEMGYDEEVIRSLPSYNYTSITAYSSEAQARDTVGESTFAGGGDDMNEANTQVLITEHYIRLDYEGDGKPRLYRVCTGGETKLLTRNGEPEVLEIDEIPLRTMTPIIQTHRVIGRSIADLVGDIQQIKTALLRSMLDNMYMSVNPRPVVYETNMGPSTIDDLLIMRPGQPIRAKNPGAIEWQEVPNVAGTVLPALQFMDTLREWRTGVSRMGQASDPNALQNQVATIANQMFNQSQAKVKLIARIFAETGIKDMFALLHKEIRKYGDQAQTVRLRNQWITVDPTQWRERADMTINVGLGTGSKAEQMAQLNMIIGAQKQAVAVGLVSQRNFYNSAKALVKLTDRKDPDEFFTAPGAPPDPRDPSSQPVPPPPDPEEAKLKADMLSSQQKFQLEQQKQAADIKAQAAQAESEIVIAREKAQLDMQSKLLDFEIKKQLHAMDMEKHAASMQAHDAKMAAAERPKASVEVKHDVGQISGPLAEMIAQLGQHLTSQQERLADQHRGHTQTLLDALARHSAPKRIRKDKDGSYVTETVQ